MSRRPSTGRRVVATLGLLVLAALLVPVFTGQALFAYASSGSMEPTIGTFDGFLVDPWARDLRRGDVIVFDSVLRAEPAVHRIVGGDASGWYTQGDANPQMDQQRGEPIVAPERVRGRVVTWPSGEPIVIDGAGVAVIAWKIEHAKLAAKVGGERQLNAIAVFAIALCFAGWRGSERIRRPPSPPMKPRVRRWLRRAMPRGVLAKHVGLSLLVVLLALNVWTAQRASTDVPVSMVVVADPVAADSVRAQPPGGTVARQLEVGSIGLLPTLVLAEPGGERVRVLDGMLRAGPLQRVAVGYELTAGDEVGRQQDTLRVWRYPALLPDGVLHGMHRAWPGSPYFGIAGVFALAGWAVLRTLGIANLPVGRQLGLREEWL